MLNQEDEEDLTSGNNVTSASLRRGSTRSLSTDSQAAASVSTQTQTPRIPATVPPTTGHTTSPVKITISKSPQGRPISVQSNSQPPKVNLYA